MLPLLALLLAAGEAKPAPLLTQADLDPALVLPPPPVQGSVQARAEMDELHMVERARSAAEKADAALDGETKNATIFAVAIGPAFDLNALPATKRLMKLVRASGKDASDRGKDEFRRHRPWDIDTTLQTCTQGRSDPLSSYPSGHTTMAFSMGAVLARLVPAKAPAIMARAARYGQSRVVCLQHFRSDVTAGEALGMLVAERLMAKPDFRAAYDAAAAELAVAGIR
ncbi:phosphatase PAP2 family protein [uncultured Sphingomonas sp.]|uniref:phosphatase PAP2 family protein n=1 Tax=uncultured Sphingomonas sp. TaxID=158754 RepID=UPI00261D3206|nr:phosphatase PAP2 family protein [uncultured Sphingomonas sp.]